MSDEINKNPNNRKDKSDEHKVTGQKFEENQLVDLIEMSTNEISEDNDHESNEHNRVTILNQEDITKINTIKIIPFTNDKVTQQVKYFEVYLVIFISLFYIILKHDIFLRFGFIFGLAINIFKCKDILEIFKFYNYLTTIGIISFLYYLIIIYNPFYYFVLYWLPFQNLFRVIIFSKVLNFTINKKINLIIESEEENQVRLKRNTIFYIYSKSYLFVVMLLLLIIRLSIWLIDDNFSQYFQSIPNKKYFICANMYNTNIIIDEWKKQTFLLALHLSNHVGVDNVFVSVFENSDSIDMTKYELYLFKEKLDANKIPNFMNIDKYYNKQSYTRIPFLAMLRNGALNPLFYINWDLNDTQVIFLNDIIFDYRDVLKLIATNNNDYDMACGMDFYDYFYDTWISKLINAENFQFYFPFFYDQRAQRRIINGDNLRVFCCWNGVASIKGAVFKDIRFRTHEFSDEESECSLLCVDMFTKGFNKIVMNPNVNIFYEYKHYYNHRYKFQIFRNPFNYFYYYFEGFFKHAFQHEYEDIDNFSSDIKLHPKLEEYVNKFKLK